MDSQSQDVFVTGDDSGTVRFWDIRQPARCLREMLAHQGPVSGLSLNPIQHHRHLIATCGRDRYVRIWDWTTDTSDFIYSVETPFTLTRVKWDPEHAFQLATSFSAEAQVFMWDIRRPFLPVSTFGLHDNVTSDLAFPRFDGLNKFVTCGKDRRLTLHYTTRGDQLSHYHKPLALSNASPFNEIICAGKYCIGLAFKMAL